MFAHGVMTALFFSAVGYIYDRTHTKAIPELGGLSRTMPVAAGFFIVAALTGIGVPCLASFWAELMVFIAAFRVYPLYGSLAVGALAVSALFILRVVQQTCYGPPNQRLAHLPDIPPLLGVPRVILVSVIVFFGLFPALMVNMIQTATVAFFNGLP
jgi:NADH-quinone oxidoreductase subunit M